MLELLAAGWGIKKASIHPMPSLYGKAWLVYAEQGKKYVLKEQFGHLLKAEHAVLFCLDAQKMPVAVPVATAGGRYHATFEKRFYCLYPFLPGDVVSDYFTAGAEKRAYLFGKAIGKLHLPCATAGIRPSRGRVGAMADWLICRSSLSQRSWIANTWKRDRTLCVSTCWRKACPGI